MQTEFETIDHARLDHVTGGNKVRTFLKFGKKLWDKTKPARRAIGDYLKFKGAESVLEGDKKE